MSKRDTFSKPLLEKINELDVMYALKSEDAINCQENFLRTLTTINNETGECFNHDLDMHEKFKQDYLYFKQNVFLLNYQQLDSGKTAVFYTPTLDSQYHLKSGNRLNKNYDPKLSINGGYKVLSAHHRDIYKNFKVKKLNEKKSLKEGKDVYKWVNIPVKFVLVFEPHLDFCCHMHVLYYVDSEYAEQLETYIKKLNTENPEIGAERDTAIVEEKDAEIDGEMVKKASPIAYLLKYLEKNLGEFDHIYNGWKLQNNIRLCRFSKVVDLSKKIFTRLSKKVRLSVNYENAEALGKLYGVSTPHNTIDLYNKLTLIKKTTHSLSKFSKVMIDTKITYNKPERAYFHVYLERNREIIETRTFENDLLQKQFSPALDAIKFFNSLQNKTQEIEDHVFSSILDLFKSHDDLENAFDSYISDMLSNDNNDTESLQLAFNTYLVHYKQTDKSVFLCKKSFLNLMSDFIIAYTSINKKEYRYKVLNFEITYVEPQVEILLSANFIERQHDYYEAYSHLEFFNHEQFEEHFIKHTSDYYELTENKNIFNKNHYETTTEPSKDSIEEIYEPKFSISEIQKIKDNFINNVIKSQNYFNSEECEIDRSNQIERINSSIKRISTF